MDVSHSVPHRHDWGARSGLMLGSTTHVFTMATCSFCAVSYSQSELLCFSCLFSTGPENAETFQKANPLFGLGFRTRGSDGSDESLMNVVI